MKALRPYQREAINAVYRHWRNRTMRNPLVVMPTGSGKSLTIASLVYEAMTAFPRTRIVMATHVKELIEQNHKELLSLWPSAPAGLFSAGLGRKDHHAPIVFGGIQSMVGAEEKLQGADILLIDECHLISRNSSARYQKFIKEMLVYRPHMKIVGFTATPWRLDSGMLTEAYKGELPLFDGIAYEVTIKQLLEAGHLVPLVTVSPPEKLDTSRVERRGGEFSQSSLSAAVNKDDINERIVREAVRIGADRGHWLAFCVGVDHAYKIRDLIRSYGVSCEAVTGEMSRVERDRAIEAYKAGHIRCLTNADVLTTGFNAPHTDYIILLRPTLSPGLYVQILGRGMRPSEGKQNCLIADFAGNIFTHGPVDQVRGISKSVQTTSSSVPRVKECPQCHYVLPVQQVHCICGYEWPRDYFAKLQEIASSEQALVAAPKPYWMAVADVHYAEVASGGGNPMLRVEYVSPDGKVASELVLLEHPRAVHNARDWWTRRSRNPKMVPGSVKIALHLAGDLRQPYRVFVQPNGKYLNVVASDFGPPREDASG